MTCVHETQRGAELSAPARYACLQNPDELWKDEGRLKKKSDLSGIGKMSFRK